MKVVFDNEYEEVESQLRKYDKNKYCLFLDAAGQNESTAIIEAHWHEWLEITYIIDGEMSVQVPQDIYHVTKGEIIVIGMQTLHRIIGNVGNYRYQCLHINIGFVLQHLSPTLLNEKVMKIQDKEMFLEYFTQIIQLMNHDDVVSQLKYKASLLNLLSLCLNGYTEETDDYDMHAIFSRILFYVSTHYNEDISLKDLSKRFNYTSQHISLMFKKYLNTNYYTYLTKLRLDRARLLLTSTHRRVLDIALECGFSSEHSFIGHFKKMYGMTPTQYRKNS